MTAAATLVRCPKCGSGPGEPCRAPNHRGSLSGVRPHKERLQAAREMGVQSMPIYNVRCVVHVVLPDIDRTGVSYLAVLVKASCVGDRYTAFQALVTGLDDPISPTTYLARRAMKAQAVAARGDRLPFAQAKVLFPAIKKSQYTEK